MLGNDGKLGSTRLGNFNPGNDGSLSPGSFNANESPRSKLGSVGSDGNDGIDMLGSFNPGNGGKEGTGNVQLPHFTFIPASPIST